jgi:hypothetical protein
VSVDAAQISPDQSVGDDGSILGTRTFRRERVADEAGKFRVIDRDFALRHARAGK